jgi:hypothetical protein
VTEAADEKLLECFSGFSLRGMHPKKTGADLCRPERSELYESCRTESLMGIEDSRPPRPLPAPPNAIMN